METPAALEGRHPVGDHRWWNESWYVDFAREDGVGGYVRLGLYPNQQRAWYWACLVLPDRPGPIVVRDHDVPLPRAGLEVRAEGLWAELICETAMEHWSIGLEAFGVALDAPQDAYTGEIGERIAVGLDLEWEVETPAYHYPYPEGDPHAHYEHHGRVHGEILIGRERIAFEGRGARDHSWGERDWWLWGWHWTAFRVGDELAANLVQGDLALFTEGYLWRAAEAQELRRIDRATVEVHHGPHGIPSAARYVIPGELDVGVEVVAAAPLLLVDEQGGRTARFARALCRYEVGERTGLGWGEWLQIQR